MKKLFIFILLITVILSGCDVIDKKTEKDEVKKLLESLTLEEKIGQMLMISYRSPVVDDNLIGALETVRPGGFILFSENFESYVQATKFINDINSTKAKLPWYMTPFE